MYLLEARRVISEPINFRTVSLMNWLSTTLQIFSLQLKLCSVAIDHRFAPLTRNTLWRNTAGVINKWWLSIVFLGIRSWSIRTKEFHKYWNGGQQPRANSLIDPFKLQRHQQERKFFRPIFAATLWFRRRNLEKSPTTWLNNANMFSSHKMHRAGQRCFELLALIGSPQLL